MMDVRQQSGDRSRPVMVIGLDGATLDRIRPWVEEGLLPTFGCLMEQGAWGTLESTTPPVTPAAWSTLATGMNPGKHGVFDFYARQEDSYQTYVVSARDRHGATIWKLLSQAGRQVTVFNVPATYPPDAVNGTMVSGFLTPPGATDASCPPEVLEELRRAVPGFNLYPPAIFSQGEETQFVQDVLSWDRATLDAATYLLNRQPWDFCFVVFTGIDILCHWMWRHMATRGASVPGGDAEARETLTHCIREVYRQADGILASLLRVAGQECHVMVVSDHGFGPLDYYMHLNTWLLQHGYLRFKRALPVALKSLAFRLGFTPLGILELLRAVGLGGAVQRTARRHKSWLDRMIQRVFLSFADVDWSRTTAYAAGYGGPIFVNLKGRQPLGIVEPGDEYQALLDRMIADLRSLRHPETGEPYVGEIYVPARDLYTGPYAHRAADLMFAPRDWANQGFGLHDFASNRWLHRTPDRTGTHRMQGIFFLRGPGIRAGAAVEGATLMDVAPTILALMGEQIPRNMDGRVLDEVWTEALQEELPVAYRYEDEVDEPVSAASVLSKEEEQALRERLEALGYYG